MALAFLDCGDGGLRHGAAEEDALIAELRRLRPELVLGPTPADRHPDHGRAHRLVADACFYAGLRRRGAGAPHRPAAVFSYMQHDPFVPSFIVDVTTAWATKERALDAYESQLHQPRTAEPGVGWATAPATTQVPVPAAPPAATKVSSPEFRLAVDRPRPALRADHRRRLRRALLEPAAARRRRPAGAAAAGVTMMRARKPE